MKCECGHEFDIADAPRLTHRLMCGDSAVASDVETLMRGEMCDLMVTDPPYGVAYEGKTDEALTIQNDALSETELAALLAAAFDNADMVSRGGAYWYATVPDGPLFSVFLDDWKRRGVLRQSMVWVKNSIVLGHSEYHYQHEPILFGWKPGNRLRNGDRTRSTVWSVDRPTRSREHPTMKPPELFAIAIRDGSRVGDLVLDVFAGSGTTIVAADQLARRCHAMEIDPRYVAVVLQRMADVGATIAVTK